MKKAIVLLLALAVIGGVVFAQDAPALKFSGYLNVGGAYTAPADGSDATWAMNGWDSGTGGRFNLGAAYNAGDYGVSLRMREQDGWTSGNTGSLMVRRLYGWFNLFDGKAKLEAGRLGDYAWATGSGGGWNSFGSVDGPVGIQLQIKPVDGLNFGAFIPTTGVTSGLFDDYLNSTLIGAAYYLKGVGDFQVGYQMMADTLTTTNNSYMYFGAAYTGMENLTAQVEGKLGYLGDDVDGYVYLRWNFDYVMGALDLGLVSSQQIFTDTAQGMVISISPTVGYSLNDTTTVEVNFTYELNGESVDASGYEIAPDVAFALAPSQTLRLGMYYDGGDCDVGTGALDRGVFAQTARTNDLGAFIDFVWNF